MMAKNDLEKQRLELPFWQMLLSTMLSFLGVSSESRRRRDFERGDPKVFIMSAVILLVLFMSLLLSSVKWVLAA